jgi:hypothetical protein
MAVLENLGYPPELVRWSEAFLRDRKVHLSFNNVISEERGQPIGVPQGSPLSPVYSITYTSSLLAKMKEWTNSSLGMYVDDGSYLQLPRNGGMWKGCSGPGTRSVRNGSDGRVWRLSRTRRSCCSSRSLTSAMPCRLPQDWFYQTQPSPRTTWCVLWRTSDIWASSSTGGSNGSHMYG